jgi:hypothetical protein
MAIKRLFKRPANRDQVPTLGFIGCLLNPPRMTEKQTVCLPVWLNYCHSMTNPVDLKMLVVVFKCDKK